MSTTTIAGWGISSSADAFWVQQLEAWRTMQEDAFSAESFFSSGFIGTVFHSPEELQDLEYQVPTIDPASLTPAGVAVALLILSVIGQDLSLQTQLEGAETTNAKSMAHREDRLLQLQQKIQVARYKTPWERMTNWMKHSFWGKFITSLIKVVSMIIALTMAIAATVASFGAAAPALAFTIAACCLMTAEMVTELATDGKSIGENVAEKITKDKGQAQKIAMGLDITLMVLEIGLSAGAAASGGGSVMVAEASVDAAAQATTRAVEMAAKIAKVVEQVEKITRYVEAAYTLIEAIIALGYAVSQSEVVKAKANAEAEQIRMETLSHWIQDIIDQYMQQIAEALGTAQTAYERASRVIQEQAEATRLIATNLR